MLRKVSGLKPPLSSPHPLQAQILSPLTSSSAKFEQSHYLVKSMFAGPRVKKIGDFGGVGQNHN